MYSLWIKLVFSEIIFKIFPKKSISNKKKNSVRMCMGGKPLYVCVLAYVSVDQSFRLSQTRLLRDLYSETLL